MSDFKCSACGEMHPTKTLGELCAMPDVLTAIAEARGARALMATDGGWYPPHGGDRALIAAAPDLLAALEGALAAMVARYTACGWVDVESLPEVVVARATIAKARGDR